MRESTSALACSQPDIWSVAGAFDIAANGLLTDPALQPADTSAPRTVPPSILKAVGWVESGWRQFTPAGRPLVSFDFGYGTMQITSGMAGAFGNAGGSIDPAVQSSIATDYRFNIGYGAKMLAQKWAAVPRIGDGDPAKVENWYYALWAYNGWGWANNPNNPRFARRGTPATDPASYPYQERVLYLVSHPPQDKDGNPLWKAVKVWMPPRTLIGHDPHSYSPNKTHLQPPQAFSASFGTGDLSPSSPGGLQTVSVRVQNTGTLAWASSGTAAISLTYHLFTRGADPWIPFSPFSPGVVALGQGTLALPHNVLPAHAVTLKETVQAPSSPGDYLVVWDLQELPASWLSQTGLLPRAKPLQVLAGVKTPIPRTPTPTPAPAPVTGAQFVADTSIPDGTAIQPRRLFQKTWLIFNNGRLPWGPGWTLRHVSGPTFGVKSFPLPSVSPCHTVNLSVQMKAPSKPGSYFGVWRAADASGNLFGDKLTVVVRVSGKPPVVTPTPLPSPTPTQRGRPTATTTPTPTGF